MPSLRARWTTMCLEACLVVSLLIPTLLSAQGATAASSAASLILPAPCSRRQIACGQRRPPSAATH